MTGPGSARLCRRSAVPKGSRRIITAHPRAWHGRRCRQRRIQVLSWVFGSGRVKASLLKGALRASVTSTAGCRTAAYHNSWARVAAQGPNRRATSIRVPLTPKPAAIVFLMEAPQVGSAGPTAVLSGTSGVPEFARTQDDTLRRTSAPANSRGRRRPGRARTQPRPGPPLAAGGARSPYRLLPRGMALGRCPTG